MRKAMADFLKINGKNVIQVLTRQKGSDTLVFEDVSTLMV